MQGNNHIPRACESNGTDRKSPQVTSDFRKLGTHAMFGDNIVVNSKFYLRMGRLAGVIIAISLLVNCGGGGLAPGIIQPTTSPTPPTVDHHVDLHWAASASEVSGYNIYRGTQSGGPYASLNSSLISTPAYSDKSVSSGQVYYYVTTAVDSTGIESVRSNETVAVIPTP